MNLAGDALEKAVKAAHQEPGLIDFAAVVVAICLVICTFCYLAKRTPAPAQTTFQFFAEEGAR